MKAEKAAYDEVRTTLLFGLFALKIPPDSTANYGSITRAHLSLPVNTIQSSRDYWGKSLNCISVFQVRVRELIRGSAAVNLISNITVSKQYPRCVLMSAPSSQPSESTFHDPKTSFAAQRASSMICVSAIKGHGNQHVHLATISSHWL